MDHHVGRCIRGPYHGQIRNYHQSTMTVFSYPNVQDTGEYIFEPFKEGGFEGHWIWRGLTIK